MKEYNCGSSGIILIDNNAPTFVIKRTKKKSIHDEFYIHQKCYELWKQKSYTVLKILEPFYINSKSYKMEKIQDKEMVLEPNGVLKNELDDFIKSMHFTAFDFELWKQDDGTVYLIDFDKFTFTQALVL